MKIWGDIPKVPGIYGSTGKISRYTKTGEVLSKKDELSISGTAKDFSIALKAVKQIPDVRQGRINEIVQKMERGEYSVKASEVAEKILEAFKDNKV
ncbi:MAG: flagellar biosynthesis anti-sigma factor FlgM [Clostridiaceae bacterium]|nr:flagellar biosynthesis anti-sigma factor FlgM [Clostridiaceae bacterium]